MRPSLTKPEPEYEFAVTLRPPMSKSFDRRDFLGISGTAVLCTVGGRKLKGQTDVDGVTAKAAAHTHTDAAAHPHTAHKPPRLAGADRVDKLKFGTPDPAPGGKVREYWVQARSRMWDTSPTGKDDWMGMKIRPKSARSFRAYLYQAYSPGFASPLGPATMPGPTLEAEVGDVLKVHVRNGDEHFGQAITMHPHGVRYTPDYDGAYYGDHTRVGGNIAPGEEFTYVWECVPESVGVWPYHDHGPNHVINSLRGLFGALIVREKGARRPDVETVLFMHALPPQATGLGTQLQAINGRVGAGNTPTVRARVGQDVAFHVFGGDSMFHTFHVHGHRWKDPSGAFIDNPILGPSTSVTARWTEDNPGRWLYHCHVPSHEMGGMSGWFLVDQ